MKIYSFKTKRFYIYAEALPEEFPDFSFDETGETARQIDSAELECFCVRVATYCDGLEIAADYLGNCIYAKARDFRDHFGLRRNGHGSYFSDMVKSVVSETRKKLKNLPKLK